jgi:formate hydrogenlyase transcriptional activator
MISLAAIDTAEMIDEGIIGQSTAIREVLDQVRLVAPTDSTVLVCGETGTGKELIAHAVHNRSARRAHPFVKTNLAAFPTGLLESELFGHERGAFTGAVGQRVGRFELANRGTIFLDEIGEAPLELQPKLLRVLQEREFERLGSSRTIRTDARLVTATNVSLPDMVDAKRFRADLYYRLNVFPIVVPPLRERQEDIPLLVRHFARHFALRTGRPIKWIPSSTMKALVEYGWPGNIRELQHLIERAVIRSAGERLEIQVCDLEPCVVAALQRSSAVQTPDAFGSHRTLEETERAQILATLRETGGVLSGPRGAAQRLGIHRSTLQFRMKKLGIERRPSEYEQVRA